MKNIYENLRIREKLLDFLKGAKQGKLDASYILGRPVEGYGNQILASTEEDFSWVWSGKYVIFRSLLDSENILCPFFLRCSISSPSRNDEDVFRFLEPAYRAVIDLFYRFDIEPLPLMLDQGYLFVTRVPLNSKAANDLKRIGSVADTLQGRYAIAMSKRHRSISLNHGKAHDGASRVIEYFTHRVIKEIRRRTSKPVCLYESSKKGMGRADSFYIDLDIYGDPLYLKVIDVPFGIIKRDSESRGVVLPRDSFTSLDQLLKIRKDSSLVIGYSKNIDSLIPECRIGMRNLIRSYKSSRLYQFHKGFDAIEHDAYWDWKNTYDKYTGNSSPTFIKNMIREPNPSLLDMVNIQLLTNVLMRDNWHPKHIAGLIRSKYERNYGWGALWYEYDASTRANFAVRLMAGLSVDGTGTD